MLNNKSESFPNKVESLIQVWIQVSQCRLTEHKQYVVHLMDWLKLHTLNIVLTGDWKKFKGYILTYPFNYFNNVIKTFRYL